MPATITRQNTATVLTAYQAKYFAYDLTRRSPEESERLSMALFDAAVDLNPHQIEAALFAIQSPLSKGVLLADEVGLGKTIEAGIVLCQLWAERRRRLLILCPASLRQQWALELREKFNLPAVVVDAKTAQMARKADLDPLHQGAVTIMSYQYANTVREAVRGVEWDLVVIDEAHRLRNAYRPSNKVGQGISWATGHCRKLLLTATPLQNSLLELYGLSTLIDEQLFGDLPSFREQFTGAGANLEALRQRLASFCKRTLRNQVTEYVRYTARRTLTQPFKPTDDEHSLYEAITGFLQRPVSFAIPQRQRHLTELILRKLLASSPLAIADTLFTMKARLMALRDAPAGAAPMADAEFVAQIVTEDELTEELLDDILDEDSEEDARPPELELDQQIIQEEIQLLDQLGTWARAIGTDTKARALALALQIGFEQMATTGANCKALIFTESRRTQEYLRTHLEAEGYRGRIVLFNGTNGDAEAVRIYQEWLVRHIGSSRVSGSRSIDIRTALVEYFRDEATIMIATEAASEGVNLQFCSLVINYDLPWNPQRVEQRIGRCHRYGQRHEVVVINFLNERNQADRRVLELLTEKFSLFSGIFGASDEILGTIESGVDFERRILAIYQQCRTSAEIEAAFQALRTELDEQIKTRMDDTRQLLLEHFDDDVHQRLKLRLEDTRHQLDKFGARFWALTRTLLAERAAFEEAFLYFDLFQPPLPDIQTGRYFLLSKSRPTEEPAAELPEEGEVFRYRLSHPLGEYVLDTAKALATPMAHLIFNVSEHPTRLVLVEELCGMSGYLTLTRLCLESYEHEEYLLFSAFDETGQSLDQETCEKMLVCAAQVADALSDVPASVANRLHAEADRHVRATISQSLERNNIYFNEAREKLERWADDLILAAEKSLRDTKEQIKQQQRQSRLVPTLDEQKTIQQKISQLEQQQRRQRRDLFDAEDEITQRRNDLIEALEKRLTHRTTTEHLFTIRWAVV